jgi:ketosteroid isomerase-like protein
MIDSQAVVIETLKKFLEAHNSHKVDSIMEFFAEDCSMDLPRGPNPWGTRLIGKKEVREAYVNRFKWLPDSHYGKDRHWVLGNVGFSEWTLSGTTPNGERLEVCGCDHLEFRNGEIIRKNSYWKIVENEK